MSRPLVISDCDEVLLHMVSPFREWLDTSHGVSFNLAGNDFANALRWKDSNEVLEQKDIWKFLNMFFDTEMDSQNPIKGAVEAIGTIAEQADVVILTNLLDERRAKRAEQLGKFGIHAPVYTNQGPKGPALAAILEERQPSSAIFIDDLAQHHGSAKDVVPHITRLHLCGEPAIAPHITCGEKAGHAHARIDEWEHALPWILEQLEEDV
ncbi:HAD family hydrolase [Parerythrobacter jejuensis]|uniref:HAD family hydrolase n=1 Tax=Parerythrobacter jejuensis TaxID=795812 RepID=A0A845AMA3_9SPHN|nr:HAD family hydrolase [Parerythrobacter jejuensis]MXP30744.1 HAD family hydrolase [Parerythrobacter jejuensis]MXP33504.1 HAD family hydrolase [Parerythrobacter jejuensis]